MLNKQSNFALLQRVWSAAVNGPDKIIIIDGTRTWTWRELLWRATAYADALEEGQNSSKNKGIVPILVERNGETVAAILGAIISGRGFSPLSPQQPAARLAKCFDALDAKVVISQNPATKVVECGEHLEELVLSKQGVRIGLPPQPSNLDAKQILYVLFTSGSTGVPKGVMADCGNIENTMMWSVDMLDWHENDVIGCCTNFYFDISMFDVFTMLYFDVPLAIYSSPSDAQQVVNETSRFKITSVFGVPTFFSNILRRGMLQDRNLNSLRRIVVGGDFFPPAHILGWCEIRPDVDIYNVWGPTETSIVNTMYKITSDDFVSLRNGRSAPVGKAHERMPFCLIDETLTVITDTNQRGEICMLGPCVTLGYLGDLEQTSQAYIMLNEVRAFRTKDIGYIDESGNLFIVGRMGSMVKVAGYRVDLGEVEFNVRTLEEVHNACAFVVELELGSGNRELWLALEKKDTKKELDIYSIKKRLRQVLPFYMVPKRIMVLKELPLNANGKIDRSALVRKVNLG